MFKIALIRACIFGVAIGLWCGGTLAQSSTTCIAMGPNMLHCDTMNMAPPAIPPPPRSSASPAEAPAQGGGSNPGLWGLLPQNKQDNPVRDTLGAIGDALLVGGGRQPTYARNKQVREEQAFRVRVGKMLADGDCQGAARVAFESGRLELGQLIIATCLPNSPQVTAESPH